MSMRVDNKVARYQLYYPTDHVNFLDALKILVASIMKAEIEGGIVTLTSIANVWKVAPEQGYSAIRLELKATDIVGFKRIVKGLLKTDPHPLLRTIQPAGTKLFSKTIIEEPTWTGELIKIGHWYVKELTIHTKA